jgi:hypothetical protein
MNIEETLHEFAYNLQSITPSEIKEPIKIILPYYLYRQFLDSAEKNMVAYSQQSYELSQNARIKGRFTLNTMTGIQFTISCKEIEDDVLHKSLKNFFKDITEG